MRDIGIPRSPRRRVVLGLLALWFVLLPDGTFSAVTGARWEETVLRILGLLGVSLLAVLPWVRRTGMEVQRRLRWWSIPGLAAVTIYLLSTDPVYLFAGFCLLAGATADMWMTRAHNASEALRVRLTATQRYRR